MGSWGAGIFSDDIACDVKREYVTLLGLGYENEEATKMVIDHFNKVYSGTDDEPVFWFALALSQWNVGRLLDFVKEQAIYHIDDGADLEIWSGNKKAWQERNKVLSDLRSCLQNPTPLLKKIAKPKDLRLKYDWLAAGDLVAYQITSHTQENYPMYLQYALLKVLKKTQVPISKIVKNIAYWETVVFGLYGWIGPEIPNPAIESKLEFIPFRVLKNDKFYGNIKNYCWEYYGSGKKDKGHISVIRREPSFKIPKMFLSEVNGDMYGAWKLALDNVLSRVLVKYLP